MRNATETEISIAFMEWIHLVHPTLLCYHTPNGERRSAPTGKKLKRMGVLPGVPDYTILKLSGCQQYVGLFLELKSNSGRLSDPQRQFRDRLPDCFKFGVAYSLEGAINIVNHYLRPKK
tara:strand:+ start:2293 stop:2649 length:357 start_codon:yes stop_codon:yes gene_type:complete